MSCLARQIEGSRYACSLYGWTSMIDLYIAQTPSQTPFDGPRLRISVLDNDDLEFRYIDTGIEARQWHRVVKGEQALARLERFFDQLHWFAHEPGKNA